MRRLTFPSRSTAPGSSTASGYTMAELVVTMTVASLLMATATFAWSSYQRKTSLTASVHTTKLALNQARLQAIFQNVNHFVVFDPDEHEVKIYRDDNSPLGELDDGDSQYSTTKWSPGVELGLPSNSTSISSPLDGETLTEGWSVPGSVDDDNVMAVMFDPLGKIRSNDETSTVIDLGTIVFSDTSEDSKSASISIQGQSGSINTYKLEDSLWVKY